MAGHEREWLEVDDQTRLEHAETVFPWMRQAHRDQPLFIHVFDPPGKGSFRFALSRGKKIEHHRYSPDSGYTISDKSEVATMSRRLRQRIGWALMKAVHHDWKSPEPFKCLL